MNTRTTLSLGIIFVLLGIGWLTWTLVAPRETVSQSESLLAEVLVPERLQSIEIKGSSGTVVLKRDATGRWALPGGWPIRDREVQALIDKLTHLESRFAPIRVETEEDLQLYGLTPPAVTVQVKADDKAISLAFGEPEGGSNRFARPTYLRVDKHSEILQLPPGLVGFLDRPQGYYQQRRLFQAERVADKETGKKIEQLRAKRLRVIGKGHAYMLERTDSNWVLREPVHDRVDPEKRKEVLAAVPDIWAEQFFPSDEEKLKEYGLEKPNERIEVTGDSDERLVLVLGAEVPSSAPPPLLKGLPATNKLRYAKLKDNAQVFAVKVDRLEKVLIDGRKLRDLQLVRFKTDDVEKLVISRGKERLEFAKKDSVWRMSKPFAYECESFRLTEILDELSSLQSEEKDIIDKGDPKQFGLAPPATTVELHTKGKQVLRILFGKHDKKDKKVYARLEPWQRIDRVADRIRELVGRPPLEYRARRVINVAEADLTRLTIEADEKKLAFVRKDGTWRLAAPVDAEADTVKTDELIGKLRELEAEEFIGAEVKDQDLDKKYGLKTPAIIVTLERKDKKPPIRLLIGKQQVAKKRYFALLAGDKVVFTIGKDIRDLIARKSTEYVPLKLTDWLRSDVNVVRIRRTGSPEYSLHRENDSWKIQGPFEALAASSAIDPLLDALTHLEAKQCTTHEARDLAAYGLGMPYLQIVVEVKTSEKSEKHILRIGKTTGKDAKDRYVQRSDNPAVFIIDGEKLAKLDVSAIDLLDRKMLALDRDEISSVAIEGNGTRFTVQKSKGDHWQLLGISKQPAAVDAQVIRDVLDDLAPLQAKRYAAYGKKIAWKDYGLEKPSRTVTIKLAAESSKDKKAKPRQHVVFIGNPVPKSTGEYYAKLDDRPAVFVIGGELAKAVVQDALYWLDRSVLNLDAEAITAISRTGKAPLRLIRQADGWQIVEPAKLRADQPTVAGLLSQLAQLRAERVAAFEKYDPKAFGLDKPLEVKLITGTDATKSEIMLQIGKRDGSTRYLSVRGRPVVYRVAASSLELFEAPILAWRDRDLLKLTGVNKVTIVEQGGRKVTFANREDGWKMVAPIEDEAEQSSLQTTIDLVSGLRAVELIAETDDVSPYGLDSPVRTWQLYVGDKEAATLVVGSEEIKDKKKTGRRYAKLAASKLVFLIDADLATRLLAEYRDRQVWPTLDAAFVKEVVVSDGKVSWTLAKQDGNWRIDGKPANDAKVTPFLDTLARLKAKHYVQDKNGNRKLYGLDPAVRTITVDDGEERTLLIGRPRGKSEARYGAIASDASGAIFVIDANTARTLMVARSQLSESSGSRNEGKKANP